MSEDHYRPMFNSPVPPKKTHIRFSIDEDIESRLKSPARLRSTPIPTKKASHVRFSSDEDREATPAKAPPAKATTGWTREERDPFGTFSPIYSPPFMPVGHSMHTPRAKYPLDPSEKDLVGPSPDPDCPDKKEPIGWMVYIHLWPTQDDCAPELRIQVLLPPTWSKTEAMKRGRAILAKGVHRTHILELGFISRLREELYYADHPEKKKSFPRGFSMCRSCGEFCKECVCYEKPCTCGASTSVQHESRYCTATPCLAEEDVARWMQITDLVHCIPVTYNCAYHV
jgi:hypothetical protein